MNILEVHLSPGFESMVAVPKIVPALAVVGIVEPLPGELWADRAPGHIGRRFSSRPARRL